MRRLGWACLLGCAAACGNTDPVTGGPGENSDEDGEQYVRPDGGRDSGTPGNRDGGTPRPDSATPRDSGFAECADTRVDAEKKPASVNVVWVVDTSGSMDQEAAQVQQNMNRFAQQIREAGLTDYRVVLVSEREFVSIPEPLGSDAAHFLHVEQEVGSDEPLTALLDRYPDYADFLIDGALTHFVAVTDDESEISAQDFESRMGSNLSGKFIVNAIASPPGETGATIPIINIPIGACTGPYGSASGAGQVYWDAAEATGGLTFSICSGDWSALLDQLAKAVGESAAVPCSLELPTPPQGQELRYDLVNVVLGDDALPRVDDEAACGSKAGWYWDNAANPSGIRLCTKSCDAAENGGSIQVAIGCSTIVM
ncbi:MAG: hypothetical protein ABW352_19060 [Polyangiales bacterium]